MTVTVTMLQTRRGEDGEQWSAGESYTATEAFARWLVQSNLATATLPLQDSGIPKLTVPEVTALIEARRIQRGTYLVSMLGDSISDDDLPTVSSGINGPRATGRGNLVQALSMGRVRLHTARATGGYTIAQIAADHVPAVISDEPDIVIELSGSNDTYGATTPASAAAIFAARRDTIWRPLLDEGIMVVACTLPLAASRTSTITAAQHAAARQLNEILRAAVDYDPMLVICDLEAAGASASGANEGLDTALYVSSEATYLHPNDSGAMSFAREHWRVLQARGIRPGVAASVATTSPYSVGVNPRGNGNNSSGTNLTTLGTGISGTGPDGWNFNRTGTSTATVTPAAVARSDGRPGQLTQIEVTIGSASNAVQLFPALNAGILLSGGSGVNGTNRASSTAYVQGVPRKFSDGNWYKVVAPGTTASSEPGSLPSSIGGMVTDGTVVWMRCANIAAGSWLRAVAEFYFTAHATETIWPQVQVKQYASGYANLAAGVVFEQNATTYTAGNAGSSWGSVHAPGNTGHNGYAVGQLPLNEWLRLESPWAQVASDTVIIEPMFRIIGGASATCTVQVGYCDLQIRA